MGFKFGRHLESRLMCHSTLLKTLKSDSLTPKTYVSIYGMPELFLLSKLWRSFLLTNDFEPPFWKWRKMAAICKIWRYQRMKFTNSVTNDLRVKFWMAVVKIMVTSMISLTNGGHLGRHLEFWLFHSSESWGVLICYLGW